jgi:hypothetical protein
MSCDASIIKCAPDGTEVFIVLSADGSSEAFIAGTSDPYTGDLAELGWCCCGGAAEPTDILVNDGGVGDSRPYAGDVLLHDGNVTDADAFAIEHPGCDIDTAPKVYKREDGQLVIPCAEVTSSELCEPVTAQACVPSSGALDDAALADAAPGGCCPTPGSTYLEQTSGNGTVNQPFTPLPQNISTTVVGDMVFITLHVAFSAEGGVDFQPSQLSITNLTGATNLTLLSDVGGWNVQGQTWDGTHQVVYAADVAGGGGPISFDFEYSGSETTGVMAVTVDGVVGCDTSGITGSDFVHQPANLIKLATPHPADPYTTPDGSAVVQYQTTSNNMGGSTSVTDHGTIHAIGFAGGDCQYYVATGRHADWRNGDWFQVTDPDGLTWTELQDWASDDRPGACQLAAASGFLVDEDFVGGDGEPILLACDPLDITNPNDCDQTLTCNYSRDFDWVLAAGCVLEITPIVDGVPQTPIMLSGAGSGTESYSLSQSATLASGASVTCSLAFRIEQVAWVSDPSNSLTPGECCVEGNLA